MPQLESKSRKDSNLNIFNVYFNNSGGPGEPAVITLAMETHRNDDHYLRSDLSLELTDSFNSVFES